MKLRSDSKRYGLIAMTLHWTIAALVLFMLGFGRYMTGLPKGSFVRLEAFQLHHSLGLTILLLALLRIAWRFYNRGPDPLPTMRGWELWLMKTVHYWFYILLILLPLAGWAAASASPLGVPIEFYRLFQWPAFPGIEPSEPLFELFGEVHEFLGKAILALIVLHVLGAAKHALATKDAVMKRMLPWGKV
ncbi:MAG TPA: cytochrome b [Sphingomonadales bacterium]|nr:cytochrome b [Sphingomonadales bacterium]